MGLLFKCLAICVISLLLFSDYAFCQNTLELIQDGAFDSYVRPVPAGPTSTPQTVRFYVNKDGALSQQHSFQKASSELTVTASFDEQVYLNVPGNVTGMTFGALSGAAVKDVRSTSVFNSNYQFVDTTGRQFTTHPKGPSGQGFDMLVNPGFQIFVSTKPLLASLASTSDTSRYYYGKLRLTFSRAINNPVISLVGLGATTSFDGKRLGFATELELMDPKLKLRVLSANDRMILDSTATKIQHDRSYITGSCDTGAACGSLLVEGTEIKSLTFAVYIRPDGREGSWGKQKVTNSGDSWHLVISLPEQ